MTPTLPSWSMDASGEERWLSVLREHAARLAFPDWTSGPDDWPSFYTSFDDAAEPYMEVTVYRGVDRIHYRRYTGDELAAFWARLLDSLTE
ncbi:hypothetical protein [Nonomuraea recticatena]